MSSRTKKTWFFALALLCVSGDAFAVIGRPLTPLSVAGVARRSVRRSVYMSAPVVAAPVATGVAVGTAIATLPAGCGTQVVGGASYYACGSTFYQPRYDGPNLIYVAVPPP